MASSGTREAFVTLATNNYYAHGVIALGESLRQTGTQKEMVAMLTEGVSEDMRIRVGRLWNVKIVEEMNTGDEESLALIKRPELGVTLSKIQVWRLEEYSKCVFLDADTLVLSNVDEMFLREEFSAAPDIGWPDLFNSGVFVLKPSVTTFTALLELAKKEGSYDGGDQGLLNTYWSNWSIDEAKHRLPFTYNVVANLTYSYPPAIKRFFDDIKIIHFLGSVKPWTHHYDLTNDTVILYPGSDSSQYGAETFIKKWWQTYCSALPTEPTQSGESGGFITITESSSITNQQQQQDQQHQQQQSDDVRRISWEKGQPDYYGADQSDNIIAHINARLND